MDEDDHEHQAEMDRQRASLWRCLRAHLTGDYQERLEEEVEDLENTLEQGGEAVLRLGSALHTQLLAAVVASGRASAVLERRRVQESRDAEAQRRDDLRTAAVQQFLDDSSSESEGSEGDDGQDRAEDAIREMRDGTRAAREGAPEPEERGAQIEEGVAEQNGADMAGDAAVGREGDEGVVGNVAGGGTGAENGENGEETAQ